MKVDMNTELLSISDALNRPFELPDDIKAASNAEAELDISRIDAHCFLLGDIGFLIPANMASEVAQDLPLCRVPRVPRWFWGMVNLRGNLLPVFDLRDLFKFGQSSSTHYKMLVMHIDDDMVGIVIDSLPERVTLEKKDKLTGQPLLPEPLRGYSRICYKKEDRIWVDLNVEGFFTSLVSHW